jgi:hypothetical protein
MLGNVSARWWVQAYSAVIANAALQFYRVSTPAGWLQVVPSLGQLNAHSLGFCKEFEVESLSPPQPVSAASQQLGRVSGNRNGSVPGSPSTARTALEQVRNGVTLPLHLALR